jgi:hypothetical protein
LGAAVKQGLGNDNAKENFEKKKTNYIGKIELESITISKYRRKKGRKKHIYINVVTFLVAGISLGYLGYNFYKNIYLEEEVNLNRSKYR